MSLVLHTLAELVHWFCCRWRQVAFARSFASRQRWLYDRRHSNRQERYRHLALALPFWLQVNSMRIVELKISRNSRFIRLSVTTTLLACPQIHRCECVTYCECVTWHQFFFLLTTTFWCSTYTKLHKRGTWMRNEACRITCPAFIFFGGYVCGESVCRNNNRNTEINVVTRIFQHLLFSSKIHSYWSVVACMPVMCVLHRSCGSPRLQNPKCMQYALCLSQISLVFLHDWL